MVVGATALAPYGVAAPLAAAQPVDLGGEELPAGSRTDAGNPIEITAGLWADELGSGGSGTHYFSYRRTMAGSTVHVGVVGTSAEPSSDSLEVTASAGENECDSDSESPNSSTPWSAFGAVVTVGPPDPGTEDDPCLETETVAITVARTTSGTGTDLPIAIKVVEEAPAQVDAEGSGLPVPEEEVRYQVPDAGSADDLTGGTSFDDAPLLDPVADGVTISTAIAEGEERLYRVPAGWEQQVVAAVRVPALEDEEIFDGPTVDLRVVEPLRNSITTSETDATTYGDYGTEPLELTVGTRPLRYLNRFDSSVGVPVLPGDFWVAIAVEALPEDAERDPLSVPVELTVAVTGQAGEGAPSYPENVPSPGGGPTPDGYSPDTPFLVGDGRFAAVASGNPVSADEDDDSWWGARRAAGLGLGVVSLACCAVGAVWLARRRVG
jgi:hypothetical protein